ncbi:MAG: sugar phosphate isomerase/epimerase family protein [Candidatus Aerophobetes bacterium]|nr:sugar phosphate isomerase/epimerase family protein [Candidatus Aerophobetes bacterium]
MKKGINYWSFPGVLSGKPERGLKDCMKLANDAGFEGIELTLEEKGEINLNSSRQDITKIAGVAKEVGIELSSLATLLLWNYSLTSSEVRTREKAKDIVKKMLEFASYLEVDTVLVIPGAVDVFFNPRAEIVPYDVAYERSLEALKECARTAEKYKVNIGVENVWNKFLLSPLEMRDFIDKIGSEYVGAYFDVGNTLLTGYPEHWIRILNKRIKKVHIKDFRTSVGNVNGFVDLLEGDVNWKKVIRALEDVGYDGYLTAEILPPYSQHPEALLDNTSKSMNFILGR